MTEDKSIRAKVRTVFEDVAVRGDAAIRDFTLRFDGVAIDALEADLDTRASAIPADFDGLVERTAERISAFHERTALKGFDWASKTGAVFRFEPMGLSSAGLYVPAGSNPLVSTLLMLAIPARLAGVKEIVVCSPPQRDGQLSPLIARSCRLLGLNRVYRIGGAQAIAAMSIGTSSVPRVEKLFGPGNSYVTEAKRLAQEEPYNRAVDLVAGPSEVAIVLERAFDARLAATELLAQTEHGPDSWALAICMNERSKTNLEAELRRAVDELKTDPVLLERVRITVADSKAEAIARIKELAPEHLALFVSDVSEWRDVTPFCGAVYIGPEVSAAFGDYGLGPNHTLPTGAWARRSSALSVRDFQKTTCTVAATAIRDDVLDDMARLAELEGFFEHRRAIESRRWRPRI